MLNGKSGDTFCVALKQLLSLLLMTVAATLVPPVPNPVLSLTYNVVKTLMRRGVIARATRILTTATN